MEIKKENGSCESDEFRLEVLLCGREEAGAPGFARGIGVKVGARQVRETRIRILTGTEILEEAQTWLRIGQYYGKSADTMTNATKKSLLCTAEPVSKLVMVDVVDFCRMEQQYY